MAVDEIRFDLMARVLIPLPDRDFDVTEVAVPWRMLTDAGHEVVFATEEAGTLPAGDPRLLTGVLFGQLGAEAEPKRFYGGLTTAPEFRTSVGWRDIEQQIPLSHYGSLVPQFDYSFRTKTFLDPQGTDPISQDPYWLLNGRLAYRTPDGRIEVAGWVRNFMDKRYKVDVFDFSRDFQTILQVWGDPRTYGFTISYAW